MSKVHSIILGAPGSGKGTISSRIINSFNIKHISSGDILRNHIRNATEIGKTAAEFVNRGKLVPDSAITEIIRQEIDKNSTEHWLLDGFPRTLLQAKDLSIFKINLCINLIVPFDIIIKRLESRWIHPGSGRIYNIGFNDPKVPGKDDITGEDLVQREDDKPQFVKERLEIYSRTIQPIIDYYNNEGILKDFKGNTSDEIWPNVQNYLSNLIPNM